MANKDVTQVPSEEGKFDIEDIKDPLEEADNAKVEAKEDVDIEDAVAEDADAEPAETIEDEKPSEENMESSKEEKDELEKAQDEASSETAEKEVTDSAKAKAAKKPFPWKIVAIVVITFLVTGALALGGFYYYQKKNTPKTTDTDTTPAPANNVTVNVTPQQKTFYTNAEPTLNLRQEPNTAAAVLAKIPYGTQLTALATQNSWYKVTYSGQNGWIDSTYTQAENPLVYKNTTYGFQMTFLSGWGGYKFFPITGEAGATAAWYVALPTTQANYSETGIDKGYASMFALTVFTPDQWKAVATAEGPKPTLAVQNQQWVIAYSLPNGTPPTDLATQASQSKTVISTIKFY